MSRYLPAQRRRRRKLDFTSQPAAAVQQAFRDRRRPGASPGALCDALSVRELPDRCGVNRLGRSTSTRRGSDPSQALYQFVCGDGLAAVGLGEIAAFYKTPVGRKAIAAMPELMRQSAEIGVKRAQEHSEELQAMLDKAREEHENEPAANDPLVLGAVQ